MTEHLITIGHIDASDTLGTVLHHSAIHGNKKSVKRVLEKGIHVDFPNDEGQSPLFCACLEGKEGVVGYLLSAGANPNEKTNSGLTPVHAACFAGQVQILMKLMNEGGDLRLHDNHGRSVKDWAILQPVPKKRMKMLEFLDKTRLFAMSSSGQDLLMKKASSKTLNRAFNRRNSVTQIIRDRIGRPSVHQNLERMATSHHSIGFGQVYTNGADKSGFISAIPLVSENHLRHDPDGDTYNNGAFAVMESMWWEYTEVTVKRLHRDLDPYQGGVVDLLINEIEHIGKLRHPHILSLMGVCQNNNLDGLVLLYERIGEGSLYNYLHQKMERLPTGIIHDIAVQMCNAIVFIHLRGLIHCSISSHAISVINEHTFKLGNFEYMIETSKCDWGKKNSVTTNTNENAVYNWMAPEVMFDMPASYYCDMYSYAAVLWEMFHGEVPWDSQCAESIKSTYQKGNMLQTTHGKMAEFYKLILSYGLQLEPAQRKLSFLHVRDLLMASPKDAKYYMRTHFKHLQSTEANNLVRAPTSLEPDNSHKDRNVNRSLVTDADHGRRNIERRRQRSARDDSHGFKPERHGSGEQHIQRYMRSPGRYDEDYSYKSRQVVNQNNSCHVTDPAYFSWHNTEVKLNTTPTKPVRLEQLGIRFGVQQEQLDHYHNYKVSPSKNTENVRNIGRPDQMAGQSPGKEIATRETHAGSEQIQVGPSAPELTDSSTDNKPGKESSDAGDCPSDVPVGRHLERKTSSLGRFSYLNLYSRQSARTATAKPASHGQTDMVSDIFSTAGKLTTAGSLYALYNDHSPDLPLGQLEQREQRRARYSSLPRQSSRSKPLAESPDPDWFGGQGSVRNLAQLFSKHIEEHGLFQSVIDGTVNKTHLQQNKIEETPKKACNDFCNPDHKKNGRGNPEQQHSGCSLSPLSWTEAGEKKVSCNSYQIAYDCDSDSSNSSTFNSDATVHTSTESDMISEWVDHELRKIKRNLSKEIQTKEKNRQSISPDIFDVTRSPEITKTPVGDVDATNVTKYNNNLQRGDHLSTDAILEDYFFDDEIYSDDTETSDQRRVQHTVVESPQKTSLPMKTILKKSSASQSSDDQEKYTRPTGNKNRLSKIPTATTRSPCKKQTKEGAYANIVTIRTSCDDVGMHEVTHQMKNLRTGGTRTILKDTVNAEKIVTTYTAPK